jgi:DNA-binding LytR/AlgR family response regulator
MLASAAQPERSMKTPTPVLKAVIAEDEPVLRGELRAMLAKLWPELAIAAEARDGIDALREIAAHSPDILFLDIQMPGLTGLDLAQVLSRFKAPPPVVFVTAYDEHAVDAFELDAVDYLVKPVRPARVAEAVRRLCPGPDTTGEPEEVLAVELAGITRFIRRSEVHWVEAQGDYARLHTADGSHLLRTSLATLEQRWTDFARIHRSTLVSLSHVRELRMDDGRCTVRVGNTELVVSRRHTRELRELLVRREPPG